MINKISIYIEFNNQKIANEILHNSTLNKRDIKKTINTYFKKYASEQQIKLETVNLNLGEIYLNEFNSIFLMCIMDSLNHVIEKSQKNNNTEINHEKTSYQDISNESNLLKKIITINNNEFISHLHQKIEPLISEKINNLAQLVNIQMKTDTKREMLSGDTVTPLYQNNIIYPEKLILNVLRYIQKNNLQGIKTVSYLETGINNGTLNLTDIINLLYNIIEQNSLLNEWLSILWKTQKISQFYKKHLPEKEYTKLSQHFDTKNTPGNRPFLQQTISTDDTLTELLQTLSAVNNENLPQLTQNKITSITETVLQESIEIQNILHLFQHPVLYNWVKSDRLTPLWQLAPISISYKKYFPTKNPPVIQQNFSINDINSHKSGIKPVINDVTFYNSEADKVSLTELKSPYQIKNAGILILWPMISALFRQLNLFDGQNFIHLRAQFKAVYFLEYLIWETGEIKIEKNRLNNVLCGLPIEENVITTPIKREEKLIIEQWLNAIISQIPVWKKLTHNDIRQLFLQRPGELLINEREFNVTIQCQPFDILLTDWPWPLNIVKMPWLNHPLLIKWNEF
ncbi:contractile injection system tape measure protein [Xenorhabdus ishibashii]|uniref:Uncharacterized protein n=1 Tax=Xenorhabdus ishibashii TaxID=1034471 RepID=A0A2D0KAA9_9GAMM|nr:contractile injection system tape measure protein [Xenorhabdus ishibashii]PHM60371.1 hypothetical protein Xish_03518 [Xenorhabdus ishibashii]